MSVVGLLRLLRCEILAVLVGPAVVVPVDHSAVAISRSSSPFQGRCGLINSVVCSPITVSARALSNDDPTAPGRSCRVVQVADGSPHRLRHPLRDDHAQESALPRRRAQTRPSLFVVASAFPSSPAESLCPRQQIKSLRTQTTDCPVQTGSRSRPIARQASPRFCSLPLPEIVVFEFPKL